MTVNSKPARRVPRSLVIAAMMAVDALIIFDAFAVAYLLRFRFYFLAYSYFQPAPVDEYLRAIVVVAYFWILLFFVFGLYDFDRHRSAVDTVSLVVKAVTFGTLIILSLTYFYREFSFSRLVCVYAWVISIVLFSAFRIAVGLFRADWYRSGKSRKRIALVGSRSLARFLVEKTASQPELGYSVVGVVDSEPPPSPMPECAYFGKIGDLDRIIVENELDGVFIAHPTLGHYDLLEVIHVCEQRGVSIRMVPATYDLLVNYSDLEEVDGLPLVKVNEQSYHGVQDVVKRCLDVTVSLTLLVVTLPFWILVAVAIRAQDGGPVFFRQTRVGKDGRTFRMWKFRTMVMNAETLLAGLVDVTALDEPVYKLSDDPRVTPVGRLLRRASLDELPQLINVLLGEMSLVGPRPEEESLVARYNVWQRRRLKALPGITGLQQVKCRGSVSLSERVRWDMLYVRKRSTLLDLWILASTVWVVLRGRGAR